MPWVSQKQRAWAHATNQPWAARWDRRYGGKVRASGRKGTGKRRRRNA